MKLVFEKAQRDQCVYIKQISHGRFDKISSTCALESCGARNPARRTGRPVTVSRPMVALEGRAWWGVRTICPLFTVASRASPGPSPSLRRIGPGRTTCPLLEMRVCTVRISYRARALGHNTTVEPQYPRMAPGCTLLLWERLIDSSHGSALRRGRMRGRRRAIADRWLDSRRGGRSRGSTRGGQWLAGVER